ncbi:hypothetical protein [Sphingopyxis sp. 2PD]|uniref:hypothetical protein n=1 Tax=Sphingopyxis sp. 2PD TaxID=2502196 RepID=UPI0010F99CD5|nr:hypothetical protein [Sphingopyxis sp. 2PD]
MSALAIAAPSAATDTLTVWNNLRAAYDAAMAADDDASARYDAAVAAYEADKPTEPDVNMMLLFGGFLSGGDIARFRLLYVDDIDELQLRIIAAKGVTRWERVDRDPERIAELDKVREYRRLLAECKERHPIAAIEDEWEAAGERLAVARSALLLAPAPDYGAVRWKLDLLFGPEATTPIADRERSIPSWSCEFTDALIADMARLGATA